MKEKDNFGDPTFGKFLMCLVIGITTTHVFNYVIALFATVLR